MRGVAGEAIIGAIAGAIIGIVVLRLLHPVLYPGELPIEPGPFPASMCLGAVFGSIFAAKFGERPVPVFWLYLILIFGVITIIQEYIYHAYLPLEPVYFQPFKREILLIVLLPHILISLALAVVATLVHKKPIVRSAQQTENGLGG